jgi:hypothetical protein
MGRICSAKPGVTGLSYIAKGIIFNNMLYPGNVHLAKDQEYS